MHNRTKHQKAQIKVIQEIEKNISSNPSRVEILQSPDDFEKDPRVCLGILNIPNSELKDRIHLEIIKPLKNQFPNYYHTPKEALHMTIKNIRTVSYPPNFSENDVTRAEKIFSQIAAEHKPFNVYFYKLLTFPQSLSLVGTTDEEFDKIIFRSNELLEKNNIPDNKKYANDRYFFINITLMRFEKTEFNKVREFVNEFPKSIDLKPYKINELSLISTNVAFTKVKTFRTWKLI